MAPLSQEDLVKLLQNAGYIAYEYNISDMYVRTEGAFEEVCGWSEKDFRESDIHWWSNLMHPEDLAYTRAVQIKILAKGGAYHGQYRIRTKTGEYVLVRDDGYAFAKDEKTKLSTKMSGLISRVNPNESQVPPTAL